MRQRHRRRLREEMHQRASLTLDVTSTDTAALPHGPQGAHGRLSLRFQSAALRGPDPTPGHGLCSSFALLGRIGQQESGRSMQTVGGTPPTLTAVVHPSWS